MAAVVGGGSIDATRTDHVTCASSLATTTRDLTQDCPEYQLHVAANRHHRPAVFHITTKSVPRAEPTPGASYKRPDRPQRFSSTILQEVQNTTLLWHDCEFIDNGLVIKLCPMYSEYWLEVVHNDWCVSNTTWTHWILSIIKSS